MGTLTLVPMYWLDYDPEHVAYRFDKKDGKNVPEWFTPSNSSRVLSHDCFHHLLLDDCGYNLDAYTDANANELFATGVLLAAGEEYAKFQVCAAISAFLDAMPVYEENTDYWSYIKPLRKSEWRDEIYDFYLNGAHNYHPNDVTPTKANVIRSLTVVRRGYVKGSRIPNIRDMRYIFEKELDEFFQTAERDDYPVLNVSYDMVRCRLKLKPKSRKEWSEIPKYHGDCDAC